jgi:hypothetical protein
MGSLPGSGSVEDLFGPVEQRFADLVDRHGATTFLFRIMPAEDQQLEVLLEGFLSLDVAE